MSKRHPTKYTIVHTLFSRNSKTVLDLATPGVDSYVHDVVIPLPEPVEHVISMTPCSIDPTLGGGSAHPFVLIRIDGFENPRRYMYRSSSDSHGKVIDYLYKISNTGTERSVEELCLHSIELEHPKTIRNLRIQIYDPTGTLVNSPDLFTASITFQCSTSKLYHH